VISRILKCASCPIAVFKIGRVIVGARAKWSNTTKSDPIKYPGMPDATLSIFEAHVPHPGERRMSASVKWHFSGRHHSSLSIYQIK
jgi:hypothetical protein